MPEIRALENTARPMQRLGYLKRLIRRVTATSTSNLENLGRDLTDTVTRKTRVPLDAQRANYIKQRLYDRAYKTLKDQTNAWLQSGQDAEPPIVAMELQDLYLADPMLPSQSGKLVKNDWRKYPQLGVNLGLIRAGTYSHNTRALSFLHFTPERELKAFLEYQPGTNPMRLSRQQTLLLLYSFLENDGEVVALLWQQLFSSQPSRFSDRDAGDLLPKIYREIITRHRNRIISADERERLLTLEQSAESIARWQDAERYVGGAREEASRPRVEPYADLGLLNKPDPFKYEYAFSPPGQVWAEAFQDVDTSQAIDEFLSKYFFSVAASAWEIEAQTLSEPDEIVPYLYRAWQVVHSPGGYAPIGELALVAGIEALLEYKVLLEPTIAREALIAFQKANPYQVRFTVNRMGVMAHARFLEPVALD